MPQITCLRNPSSQSSVRLESWWVWKNLGHPLSAYSLQSNRMSGQSRVSPSKAITILTRFLLCYDTREATRQLSSQDHTLVLRVSEEDDWDGVVTETMTAARSHLVQFSLITWLGYWTDGNVWCFN